MKKLHAWERYSIKQLASMRNVITEEITDTIERMNTCENVFKHTVVPTTEPEVQKSYLSGVHSIIENLPCPDAIMTPDGCHSYLPLPELMSTYLAHGYNNFERTPTQNMGPGHTSNTYYQSSHYEDVCLTYNNQVVKGRLSFLPLLIAVKDWSDDFDKNNSAKNRHSIWMKTVTVLLDNGNGSISYNSFVIAIGSKGDSHEDVKQLYANDLRKMSEPNKYLGNDKNVVAVVYLAASIQDRPERDSANGTLGHSSTFCKRFQYCCFIDKVSPVTSCVACFNNQIVRLQTDNKTNIGCNVCSDWDMSGSQTLLHKKLSDFTISFKWPLSFANGSPSPPAGQAAGKRMDVVFRPVQMTYKWMKEVMCYCFFNHQTRLFLNCNHQVRRNLDQSKWGWKKGESENYLRGCGLNRAIAERIIHLATECCELEPKDALHQIEDIVPALWQRPLMQLHHHHDAIFHMIFHGILPDIVQLVSTTLKIIEIRAEVVLLLPWLVPLLRDFHFHDLPVLPFTKGKNADPLSMGAWVGSQKVAFS
jgi:hypothetical protein